MAAEQPRIRPAVRADATAVIALVGDGFASYRDFAPSDWAPPEIGQEEELAFERFVARGDVWYVVADDAQGHAGQCGFTAARSPPCASAVTRARGCSRRTARPGRGASTRSAGGARGR